MAGPTLDLENDLRGSGHALIAGMDEVGRGALAGPVSVGVVVVDASITTVPAGLDDSKQLTAPRRNDLVPVIQAWARSWAVGHASAGEIDDVGIVGALRRAGLRALASLPVSPDVVILDGKHDWLTDITELTPFVTTQIKADRMCASVAAASVLAKVQRDEIMTELARSAPEYRWDSNKGYGSSDHLEAIARLGPTELHRRSWKLPTS